MGGLDSTRGIVRPGAALERFRMERTEVAADLAGLVEYFWVLHWDLAEPHTQRVLPHPSVNMTFMAGRSRVTGVVSGSFTETIEGVGRVVGLRFRPGGFRPYLGAPVSTITDRELGVAEVFGPGALELAERVVAAQVGPATALIEEFLRERDVPDDPVVGEVASIVARIEADVSIRRVDELATALATGVRRLQRMFAEYVGVGPKQVIRRYRMHEAAARAASGEDLDWAGLAADLGYADQAHFTRDFTAAVGTSPAQYARDCAEMIGE